MNKYKRYGLFLLLLAAAVLNAQSIQVSLPDTSGFRGDRIIVPIRVHTSLTDQNVTSYQLNIQYDDYYLTVDSVLTKETLTAIAGMSCYHNFPSPNTVRIAAAGTTSLQDEGVLIIIRFRLRRSGYSSLIFTDAQSNFFNEGNPPVELVNGSLNIWEPPTITVYPDGGILAVGETEQLYAYNATEPVYWQTNNPTLAEISSDGMLTALSCGTIQVIAMDGSGLKDTTDNFFEIRPLKLFIGDMSAIEGSVIDIPVYSTLLTGIGIVSGTFALSFDPNILKPLACASEGTLLESCPNVTINTTISGMVKLAFAGSSPLSGEGTLCMIRFQVQKPGWTKLHFIGASFNETLLAKTEDGSLTAESVVNLPVEPLTWDTYVGETVQFAVHGGIQPLTWEVSDSTLAQIDSDGLMTALKSGTVRVFVRDGENSAGISGDICIYNVKVVIGSVYTGSGMIVDVPVLIEKFSGGMAVSAYHIILDFDSGDLTVEDIIVEGTLSNGWSIMRVLSENRISIAAAGANSFNTEGILFKIRFRTDNSLLPGENTEIYFYRLLFNENDPSVMTYSGSVVIADAPAAPVPVFPENESVIDAPDIEFSWETTPDAEHHYLQISTDDVFQTLIFQDTMITENSRMLTGFENGLYYWRVNASSSAGTSEWSAVWSFTVNSQVIETPDVPVLLSPEDGSDRMSAEIEFIWNLSAGADTYRLQVANSSSFADMIFTDTLLTDTPLTISGFEDGLYFWRINASNSAGTSEWSAVWSFTVGPHDDVRKKPDIPRHYALMQNYPNPFNLRTLINYALPERVYVELIIYDLTGKKILTLVSNEQAAGYQSVIWDGCNDKGEPVSTGIYINKFQAGTFAQTKKMVVMK